MRRSPTVVMFAISAAATCADGPPGTGHQQQPQQQVVIVSESERSTVGTLYRFQDGDEGWHRVGVPISVVFGRTGVGDKEEGDGRSPQGRFAVGRAFGYDPLPPEGLRLEYLALGPNSVCVDDPASPDYNRILDATPDAPQSEFSSAERMRRDLAYGDSLYEFGVVVQYNPDGRRDPETGVGLGSCIFLHVWRGPSSTTVGCTAMDRQDLLDLMAWLDPARDPMVIQGSRAFLEGLVAAGELPFSLPLS